MGKSVAVIHTSFVSVDALKELFKEIIPEVEMINIVDDSLLKEVMANGQITPAIVRRISTYAQQAEALGVDLVLNQCSSVTEAVDVARKMLKIPYIKIDEAMAEEAVTIGGRISVVATVASTMGPSVRLIERAANRMNKQVDIRRCLIDGALDVLMKEGNKEKHNKMVLDEIERIVNDSDVIVLAQGSMIVLLPQLKHIKIPVLTSPRSGVNKIKEVLGF
ncbi:MAG: aspartate/glutamate racemase family protein [Clostridiaceae bacterium]|nr:aspartate/glutamate racemase family protein [Clostridiaceae bacterium]